MLYNLHFSSSKCRLFHNATLFGFCINHILNARCAKIKKKKSVAKRLNAGPSTSEGNDHHVRPVDKRLFPKAGVHKKRLVIENPE